MHVLITCLWLRYTVRVEKLFAETVYFSIMLHLKSYTKELFPFGIKFDILLNLCAQPCLYYPSLCKQLALLTDMAHRCMIFDGILNIFFFSKNIDKNFSLNCFVRLVRLYSALFCLIHQMRHQRNGTTSDCIKRKTDTSSTFLICNKPPRLFVNLLTTRVLRALKFIKIIKLRAVDFVMHLCCVP